MQIELIQPVAGEGVHVEFLERHRPARTTSVSWSSGSRTLAIAAGRP